MVVVAPSLAIGIVYDQELIWHMSSGPMNCTNPSQGQVDVSTAFHIGSTTKVSIYLVVAMLAVAGALI